MNLRSVTGFLNLTDPIRDSDFRALRELTRAARENFAAAGFPVQTARVSSQSIADVAPRNLKQFAQDFSATAQANGIDYAALGALPGDHFLIDELPAALIATENIFGAAHIASRGTINFPAISKSARVMRALADSTTDGFGNLRFAALANCSAHSPFFPASYHDGGAPAFAIATEGASLAVDAFSAVNSLDDARANLIDAIERAGATITQIANNLATRFNFRFVGIDFSFAPYPDQARSIGAAIEKLVGAPFGKHGTLFATAFLTDCLNRAQFPRTGFSGVMLPVLEDPTLAMRSKDYTLDSLLLYSAVCGTGLDTIPLPGDTTTEAIAAILLDLATLAVKLNKPLTARLMPIPGLRAGDSTRFTFEYFANAKVMSAGTSALKFLGSDKQIEFLPNQPVK